MRTAVTTLGLLLSTAALLACGSDDSDTSSTGAAGTMSSAGGKGAAAGTGGITSSGGVSAGAGKGGTNAGGEAGAPAIGGAGGAAGGSSASGAAGTGNAGTASSMVGPASVLQHHNHASRDGVYVDPALTQAVAKNLARDPAFDGALPAAPGGGTAAVYSQVLYVDAPTGTDLVIATTENNDVVALDAASGKPVWSKNLGVAVPHTKLPCGNIDPLGVTGTPVIDPATRTLYVNAMTTPDGGATKEHKIFALSLVDGSVVAGWPVNVNAAVSAPVKFDSSVQNQRSALLIFNGSLYVAYGGHWGDCGSYHGWVVGVSLADPTKVSAFSTKAKAGGIWAPGGLAADADYFFAATGNTFNATTWGDGEGVLRFGDGAVFSGQTTDYYTPNNWVDLDNKDTDISGSGPIVVDLPGATPSKLIVQLGKDGNVYLLDRDKLGGMGAELAKTHVSNQEIIQAGAVYTAGGDTYVSLASSGVGCPTGQSGGLTTLRLTPGSPPSATVAWCADQKGRGSPMVTTTDGKSETVVWSTSTTRLYGFDGATGAVIYGGGGSGDKMGNVRNFNTSIAAKGRIFVAGDGQVYAFK